MFIPIIKALPTQLEHARGLLDALTERLTHVPLHKADTVEADSFEADMYKKVRTHTHTCCVRPAALPHRDK